MRFRRLLLPAGAAILGAAALALPGLHRDAPHVALAPAFAGDPHAAAGPRVALLATAPNGAHTSLYVVRAGEAAPMLAPVATFTHLEGAAVRGAVLPGSDVVVAAADTAPTRDASFAASLFRVAPHAPPQVLCDRVVHASRPLVTAAGRVFVSRGVAGPPLGGSMRVDDLTIDEIDPATGAARTVHVFSGYLAFLAGARGAEIVVYRIGPGGADLAGVDADTDAVRVIAPLLPFARDFSIDEAAGAVVFQERDEQDSRMWTVDRLDLATGARTRLHRSASMSLAPFAWPGGGVALSPNGRGGLSLLGAGRLDPAPLGEGVDMVRAASAGGAWVAALHTVAGRLPVPFAVDTRTGAAAALAAPPGVRVEIAGFVNGGAP
jgi:hypothetical protein